MGCRSLVRVWASGWALRVPLRAQYTRLDLVCDWKCGPSRKNIFSESSSLFSFFLLVDADSQNWCTLILVLLNSSGILQS